MLETISQIKSAVFPDSCWFFVQQDESRKAATATGLTMRIVISYRCYKSNVLYFQTFLGFQQGKQ